MTSAHDGPSYERLLRKLLKQPAYERPTPGPAPCLKPEITEPLFPRPREAKPNNESPGVSGAPAAVLDRSSAATGRDTSAVRQERRVDVITPETATIGKATEVLVQVRLCRPASSVRIGRERTNRIKSLAIPETAAFRFPWNQQTEELKSAKVRVKSTAPDFAIIGDSEKLLLVPPDAGSTLVSFFLKPAVAGNCGINVELFDLHATQIGMIFIETAVDTEPRLPSQGSPCSTSRSAIPTSRLPTTKLSRNWSSQPILNGQGHCPSVLQCSASYWWRCCALWGFCVYLATRPTTPSIPIPSARKLRYLPRHRSRLPRSWAMHPSGRNRPLVHWDWKRGSSVTTTRTSQVQSRTRRTHSSQRKLFEGVQGLSRTIERCR